MSEHVCGLSGYNGMIDPPCPGCVERRSDAPRPDPAAQPRQDELFLAYAAFRDGPSLQTGNALLRVVRETLALVPNDGADSDVAANRDVSNERIAEVLSELRDFCPSGCHWALNVGADRLRGAAQPTAPPDVDAASLYRHITAAAEQWRTLGGDLQKEYHHDFQQYLAPYLASVLWAPPAGPSPEPSEEARHALAYFAGGWMCSRCKTGWSVRPSDDNPCPGVRASRESGPTPERAAK